MKPLTRMQSTEMTRQLWADGWRRGATWIRISAISRSSVCDRGPLDTRVLACSRMADGSSRSPLIPDPSPSRGEGSGVRGDPSLVSGRRPFAVGARALRQGEEEQQGQAPDADVIEQGEIEGIAEVPLERSLPGGGE